MRNVVSLAIVAASFLQITSAHAASAECQDADNAAVSAIRTLDTADTWPRCTVLITPQAQSSDSQIFNCLGESGSTQWAVRMSLVGSCAKVLEVTEWPAL